MRYASIGTTQHPHNLYKTSRILRDYTWSSYFKIWDDIVWSVKKFTVNKNAYTCICFKLSQLSTSIMAQEYSIRLANEALYMDQDIVFNSRRHGKARKTMTRSDQVHHHQTFVQSGLSFTTAPYPTNISIQQCSILPNARVGGIHDLLGTDAVWVGAMISNTQQRKRDLFKSEYPPDITIVLYLIGCSRRSSDWPVSGGVDWQGAVRPRR